MIQRFSNRTTPPVERAGSASVEAGWMGCSDDGRETIHYARPGPEARPLRVDEYWRVSQIDCGKGAFRTKVEESGGSGRAGEAFLHLRAF